MSNLFFISPHHLHTPLLKAAYILILSIVVGSSLGFVTKAEQAPDAFIEGFISDLATASAQHQNNTIKYLDNFQQVIDQRIAFDMVARILPGRYHRKMTNEQKSAFIALVKKYIPVVYGLRLRGQEFPKYEIGQVRPGKKNTVDVDTLWYIGDQPPLNVSWRVISRKKTGLQVLDITVNGLSMIVNQRDEVESLLNKHNNDFDSVMVELWRLIEKVRTQADEQ